MKAARDGDDTTGHRPAAWLQEEELEACRDQIQALLAKAAESAKSVFQIAAHDGAIESMADFCQDSLLSEESLTGWLSEESLT